MKLSEYKEATKELREFSREVEGRRIELMTREIQSFLKANAQDKTVKQVESIFNTATEVVRGLKDGSIFKGDPEENVLRIYRKNHFNIKPLFDLPTPNESIKSYEARKKLYQEWDMNQEPICTLIGNRIIPNKKPLAIINLWRGITTK